MQLLKEYLAPSTASIMEMKQGSTGDTYLSGIMMQAAVRNGNGRVYPTAEITRAVKHCQEELAKGNSIMGELNHPDNLSINLANVSHTITDIRMEGNNAIGKMKILKTPAGEIVKALIEGGVRLGVSSRGTGNVNESGDVSDFMIVTVDIVAHPSAPDARPSVVNESLTSKKIMTLAEAIQHDTKAQKYFRVEIAKLIEAITKAQR